MKGTHQRRCRGAEQCPRRRKLLKVPVRNSAPPEERPKATKILDPACRYGPFPFTASTCLLIFTRKATRSLLGPAPPQGVPEPGRLEAGLAAMILATTCMYSTSTCGASRLRALALWLRLPAYLSNMDGKDRTKIIRTNLVCAARCLSKAMLKDFRRQLEPKFLASSKSFSSQNEVGGGIRFLLKSKRRFGYGGSPQKQWLGDDPSYRSNKANTSLHASSHGRLIRKRDHLRYLSLDITERPSSSKLKPR